MVLSPSPHPTGTSQRSEMLCPNPRLGACRVPGKSSVPDPSLVPGSYSSPLPVPTPGLPGSTHACMTFFQITEPPSLSHSCVRHLLEDEILIVQMPVWFIASSLPSWEMLLALSCLPLPASREGTWRWGEASARLLPPRLVLSFDSSTELCVGAVFHACQCRLINL